MAAAEGDPIALRQLQTRVASQPHFSTGHLNSRVLFLARNEARALRLHNLRCWEIGFSVVLHERLKLIVRSPSAVLRVALTQADLNYPARVPSDIRTATSRSRRTRGPESSFSPAMVFLVRDGAHNISRILFYFNHSRQLFASRSTFFPPLSPLSPEARPRRSCPSAFLLPGWHAEYRQNRINRRWT